LFHDFETRSRLDLTEVGAWRYSRDPSTDLWCCAYAIDDGPIELWVPGDSVPPAFVEAARNPDWLTSAFNDQFERLITTHIMGPRYGWPIVPQDRRRCSQAAALALALPAKLETVAEALKLEHRKDESGHRVMLQMARPRRARQNEDPDKIHWFDDADRRQQLYAYCRQDVATERALHQHIGGLSPEERALWVLDAVINDRGMHIDGDLLDAAIGIARAASDDISRELRSITCGAVDGVNQTGRLMRWLADHGCTVSDVQKATLGRELTRNDLPADARRVVELRLDGAHAAAAKLETMRAWRNTDGRARGTFRFHGASTGRWTSFGVQVQNMKRPLVEDMGAAIAAVSRRDLDQLRRQYAQPMSVVGDLARAMICAAPGHRLIAADFSGIESRLTAWVSGQQSKLDQWAKFDRTRRPEDEPYFITGTKTFGFAQEQARTPGKTGDLAFGYMGGVGAWRKLAPADDASSEAEIKQRQQAWRNAHPQTVRFWRALDRAAVRAMQTPGTTISCRHIAFDYDGTFLRMRLPGGRQIAYPLPRLVTNDRGDCVVVYMDNQQGKWVACRHGQGAYGGIWIENAVQAVARDLFAAAMPRLEAAGYPIVLHVHDEIVAEVPEGSGTAEEFLRILTTAPTWAEGLPIAAKVREGYRFCKITKPSATVKTTPGAAEEITAEESPPWNGEEDEPGARDDPDGEEPEAAPKSEPPTGYAGNSYASGERPWGRSLAEYIYRDANSKPYLKVARTSAKQFPQFHWDNDRWVAGKPAGPKIPYQLPELIAAAANVPIFICEGEKDADNVAALGLIATTNSEGAGKWTSDLNQWFAGKQAAYVLEDNDRAGRQHASKVASALQGFVPDIRIVSFPELPEHGDASDWIEMGGSKTQLLERAQAAPRARPDGYVLIRASDIIPRAMEWLWRGHILRGSQELLTGVPGGGKSQIHCAFVAYVTTGGMWPDGCNGMAPGNVIMLTAEDCLDQTIVPRLIAAAADRDRVYILRKIRKDNKERMFLLGEDLEELERMVNQVGDVRLITIDPITAYMGGKVDSHRATDVRGQLGPLADLAERMDVALSAITHPPKHSSQRAIDHFIGSQAFIAAARIGHMAIEEMDEDEHGNRGPTGRSLFTNPKNNVSRKMATLAYRVAEKQLDGGIKAPYVVWEEVVDITADQAVAAATPTKKTQAGGVVMFLLNTLANGPVPVAIIEERAAACGLSKDQLDRAKKKMGIVAFKQKGTLEGQWFWALPQHAPRTEAA
jgi:DNA polymerase